MWKPRKSWLKEKILEKQVEIDVEQKLMEFYDKNPDVSDYVDYKARLHAWAAGLFGLMAGLILMFFIAYAIASIFHFVGWLQIPGNPYWS